MTNRRFFPSDLFLFQVIIFPKTLYSNKFLQFHFSIQGVWHLFIRVPFSCAVEIAQRLSAQSGLLWAVSLEMDLYTWVVRPYLQNISEVYSNNLRLSCQIARGINIKVLYELQIWTGGHVLKYSKRYEVYCTPQAEFHIHQVNSWCKVPHTQVALRLKGIGQLLLEVL